MKRLRQLFLLSHLAKIFISLTPFCHNCFWLSSFIKSKQVVTCQHGRVFINYSLSCQCWQQNEKNNKNVVKQFSKFQFKNINRETTERKKLVNVVSISPPLSPQEKEKRRVSTYFGNQGNEKNKILVFFISNMNVKHIIKNIITFIIRLICSVHHCTWTPSLQE